MPSIYRHIQYQKTFAGIAGFRCAPTILYYGFESQYYISRSRRHDLPVLYNHHHHTSCRMRAIILIRMTVIGGYLIRCASTMLYRNFENNYMPRTRHHDLPVLLFRIITRVKSPYTSQDALCLVRVITRLRCAPIILYQDFEKLCTQSPIPQSPGDSLREKTPQDPDKLQPLWAYYNPNPTSPAHTLPKVNIIFV